MQLQEPQRDVSALLYRPCMVAVAAHSTVERNEKMLETLGGEGRGNQ